MRDDELLILLEVQMQEMEKEIRRETMERVVNWILMPVCLVIAFGTALVVLLSN